MEFRAERAAGDHALDILTFIADCSAAGERCALCVIVNFTGPSSRALGALMAVSETGRYAGSVSSGCFDVNVAAAALHALQEKKAQRISFGEGSDFIDVKLPCGGGVELLIAPDPDPAVIAAAIERLNTGKSAAIYFDAEGQCAMAPERLPISSGWRGARFLGAYEPKLRLIAAGRGQELIALARAAHACGFLVDVYTPDPDDLACCKVFAVHAHQLSTMDEAVDIKTDPRTAAVLMFHDHEWEPGLLKKFLETDMFYIGALGGRTTHKARLDVLRAMGVGEAALRRIHGPIGLVPAMRSAPMLAISTLAEIIDVYHQRGGGQ